MFKVIVPKATFKELEKIDTQNQKGEKTSEYCDYSSFLASIK